VEKGGGEGLMAEAEVDDAEQGEGVLVESASVESRLEICLLMSVRVFAGKGERWSECLLVSGLGIGCQVVGIHLCSTCRAYG